MRRILLAFIFTVACSGLALAAVENIKVSGDITVQGLTRDLSLGNQATAPVAPFTANRDSDDFILSQVRLRFDADLTENVSAVVQLINERLWGIETVANSDIDLDLAYFVMKEMFDYPLTLTLGRQPLRFGNALIIGDPDSDFLGIGGDAVVAAGVGLANVADDLSLRKAFDAIRTTLDYSPLVIDLVYSKVREGTQNIDDDITLMGINAGYELDEDTLLEGYFFSKIVDDTAAGAEDEKDKVFTVGIRGETDVTDQLSLFGEYAYQFGDYRNTAASALHREAFATQVGGAFQFNDDNNSAVSLTYTYLSADDDDMDNDWEAWDPMFEDQRGGEIANLFVNTGVQSVKLTGSTMPREDLTAILDVYWYRVAESPSVSTLAGGAAIAYTAGPLVNNWYLVNRDEKDLGWELDLSLLYDYTEDVQMGLVSGWFMPGDFFDSQNDETAYSLRAFAKVDF